MLLLLPAGGTPPSRLRSRDQKEGTGVGNFPHVLSAPPRFAGSLKLSHSASWWSQVGGYWEPKQKHPCRAQTVTALGLGTQVWGVHLLIGLTLMASPELPERKLFLRAHETSFLEHFGRLLKRPDITMLAANRVDDTMRGRPCRLDPYPLVGRAHDEPP